MKFFIIKLFTTVLIFTQSPVSAMLAEDEPEDKLKPLSGPAIIVDIQTFKQCVALYNYEECLSNVVDKVIVALKYQIITPNPKPQQNDDNSLRPIVIKNNAPLVLAGALPHKSPAGPDGPSRSEDADENDPLIINIPDTDWPWLDEGDFDDSY